MTDPAHNPSRNRALDDIEVHWPGSPAYARAAAPHNSSGTQQPAAVVVPADTAQVSAAVALATAHSWAIAPQATGHGAAGDIGPDTLILDTSALNDISIEPSSRTARTGAGATWSDINAAAQSYGLLGRSGTSPSVGVAGYTFGGGVGWLTRPYGLASAHLLAVDFVDGSGEARRATPDAPDGADREAWWAFRGGDGVGLATHLYFGLTPVPDLWAGYLLWPADQLAEVVTAWAAALPTIGPALTTTISLLHAAPGPPFPAGLQGRPLVHLALASSAGPDAASGLFEALHPVAPPVVNTWGRADAQRLGEIHLDPPAGIPAIGGGRWLASNTPDVATAILSAGLLERTPLQMIEIRHLANPDPPSEGAMTSVPGPFLVHAVGAAQGGGQRSAIDGALAGVWAAAAPADTGRVAPPFAEGQREPGTALEPAGLARVQAIRSLLDPAGRIRTARRLP